MALKRSVTGSITVLLGFRVANFRSIRDEQTLSLLVPPREASRLEVPPPSWRRDVSPVAAIYGANGSGKSSVLLALDFMQDVVIGSYRGNADQLFPLQRFALDADYLHRPQVFEVEVVVEETRYEYGFHIDDHRIEREWLSAYPHGRRQAGFS